ncbi:Uclacyanin 1 [Linum grandiflorum]
MATIQSNTLAVTAIVMATLLQFSAAQTTYTVGNTMGWAIPQGGASAYSNWAANNSFAVGDILVFNFAAGAHDVTKVNKADYDSCTGTTPLMTSSTSPARVTLNSSGEHYFICNFPGHCNAGQKLTVNVLSASTSSPSPAPMPSSPPPRRALSPATSPSSSTATAPTPSTTSPVAGDDSPSSAPAPSSRPPMTYTVGDSFGWNIPTTGSVFRDWAAGNDFMVGDILVFNYATGAHNVAEVTRDGYRACTTANPISLDSNPPTRITLTTPGEHFYICAIAGHCTAGQQLSINVTGPTSTTSGSPSGSATPSPPGDSSSATTMGVSAATFLSVFVALLL